MPSLTKGSFADALVQKPSDETLFCLSVWASLLHNKLPIFYLHLLVFVKSYLP